MARKARKIKKRLTYHIIPDQAGNFEEGKIDKLTKDIGVLEQKIIGAEKKFEEKVNEEAEEFETKMRDREIRTTEILAIFITLFTFISVNVSIFTRVEDLHTVIWFILLFTLCSLVLLSSIFLLISRKQERNWFVIGILLISLIFLVGLLFATNYTPQWNPKLNLMK